MSFDRRAIYMGDDTGAIAGVLTSAFQVGGKLGTAAINADAAESVAQDQAAAQQATAGAQARYQIALARLNAAQTASLTNTLVYTLEVAGLGLIALKLLGVL